MISNSADMKTTPPKPAEFDQQGLFIPNRRYGQTAVTLFLLAVFGLALLCIGIGLTWLAPPL